MCANAECGSRRLSLKQFFSLRIMWGFTRNVSSNITSTRNKWNVITANVLSNWTLILDFFSIVWYLQTIACWWWLSVRKMFAFHSFFEKKVTIQKPQKDKKSTNLQYRKLKQCYICSEDAHVFRTIFHCTMRMESCVSVQSRFFRFLSIRILFLSVHCTMDTTKTIIFHLI